MYSRDLTSWDRGICLLVEDSDFDQKMMIRAISRAEVYLPLLVANSIASARVVLAHNKIRFLLLDNLLPDGLGVDLALELSGDEMFQMIPMALVTDWQSPGMYQKAKRAGVREVMGKSDFVPTRVKQLMTH